MLSGDAVSMSSGTKPFEHAFYIGSFMGSILYGVELAIFAMILFTLSLPRNRISTTVRRLSVLFSTIMILISTIETAVTSVWGSEIWITLREKPGRSAALINGNTIVWFETLGAVSVVLTVFLGNALMIWRLYTIFDRSRKVIVFPAIVYIVALTLAFVQVATSGHPHGNFFGLQMFRIAVAYYVMAIFLNILVTILIGFRLRSISKRVSLALGEERAKVYTGVKAILMESGALYTAAGILFLVPYAFQASVAVFFGQLWSKMSAVAPLLIILRVVEGTAWRQEVLAEKLTALHFATSNLRPESRPVSKSFQLSCVVLREVQVTR